MILSIIIPTYNSSKVLGKALDSIVSQSFRDWEVLLMDGVSTDDTERVAQSFNDARIKFYSEPDKGIYDAMNKGIKKAQGEWLYFLGSDDWLLDSEVLQTVFSEDLDGVDVVYGEVEADHLRPEHSGEWTMETVDFNRCHQGIFYRRNVFKQLGLYNLDYPVLADYDLNMKWFFSSKLKNRYIPVKVAHFSAGGFSEFTDDYQLMKFLPYLKLKRGWNKYTREERRPLIKLALTRKSRKHPGRWLLTVLMRVVNM